MKITFIKHSCYTVETEKNYLVFDYYSGTLNIPDNKKIIFFVTHRHADHYNETIFNYNADLYIISDDVRIKDEFTKNYNIKTISPNKEYLFQDIFIKTVESTDEGVAILVKIDNKIFLHSGDLCHWVWPRYSLNEQKEMQQWFESEVDKFKEYKIDIVFMVLDPRLNNSYDLTGKYFLENINAKYYFPMHMWDNFTISSRFKKTYSEKYPDKKIMSISHNNQSFIIK